jgi:hypothetical protein
VTSGEQHRGHGLNEVDFEILAGLPASGLVAVAFPASDLGFREGLVIRVRPTSNEAWTGNFQCGENDHTAVYIHPDGKRLIVIAGGSDYFVDPRTKELMGQTTSNISFSCEVPKLETIVFGDHIRFWAEGKHGRRWTTPRLSWDGFAGICVTGNILIGKWYSAIDEKWHEFRMDLASGDLADPTFEADFRRVKRVIE